MNKFKIQGVGIDTSSLEYHITYDHDGYSYVHTSLSAGNDFLLKEYVGKVLSGAPLITTTECLSEIDHILSGHLLEIDRKHVDLLLVDTKTSIKEYIPTLRGMLDSGQVLQIGLYSSTGDLEELKIRLSELKEIMLVRYVAVNLCPLNFDYELLEWLREEDRFSIIGFNPFGGHRDAQNLIDAFSVPYLLSFAATYCDIVFLSSRDMIYSDLEATYLSRLIDKESEAKYVLSKSVHALAKPLKKVVTETLKVQEGQEIIMSSRGYIPDPEEINLYLGVPEATISRALREDKDVEEINNYIDLIVKPATGGWKSYWAMTRPKVHFFLKSIFGENSGILPVWISDSACIFIITKIERTWPKWMFWKKTIIKNRKFLLGCDRSEKITFLELENSD